MAAAKHVYVVAGPNGSGKTTFAREFLPNYAKCPNFVNADLIAQGLSPFNPRAASIRAGRLVLSRIREFALAGDDFGFETTLSGKTHLSLFRRLEHHGYSVHIYFLWVPAPALSVMRIKNRVADGGHDVPVSDVGRRFDRSIHNFFGVYVNAATSWMLFDNSGLKPVLAAKGNKNGLTVEDQAVYDVIVPKSQL